MLHSIKEKIVLYIVSALQHLTNQNAWNAGAGVWIKVFITIYIANLTDVVYSLIDVVQAVAM